MSRNVNVSTFNFGCAHFENNIEGSNYLKELFVNFEMLLK
jgi:hypothetical protein